MLTAIKIAGWMLWAELASTGGAVAVLLPCAVCGVPVYVAVPLAGVVKVATYVKVMLDD